jgi:hypothetical protein
MPAMRLVLITFLLSIGVLHAREEALVSGGESPDKRFCVVLIKPRDEAAQPVASFRYIPTGRIIGEHFVGSYADYEGAKDPVNTEVVWSADSRFAAIKERSTKRSTDVTIYRVSRAGIREIKTEDYFQRILHLLGASEVERYSFEKPVRWASPTDLVIEVTGDCFIGPRDAGNYRSFRYHVTIDALTGKAKAIKQIELKTEPE